MGAVVSLFAVGPKISKSSLDGHEVLFLDEGSARSEFLLPNESTVDLLLLDLPARHMPSWVNPYLAGVRSTGGIAVSIDNIDLQSQVDMTFIPSFRGPATVVGAKVDLSVIFGWDCFLLNENTEPINWQPGQRVLALTGGSDATNLGRNWPALLDASLPESTELNWVTGPFAQAPVWPQTPRIRMTQHLAPRGLQHLMTTVNYAVTVYGVSFFELLQLGIPTVVFSPYGERDDPELQEIEQEGLAIVAKDEKDATQKLIALMNNEELAAQLSGT
ncbi:MAG: hypothetical protein FJY85_21410, partial [Deltaproteobacteria bacterium]|nr:hypothetical protein [Deltaproteobacteria bacterium]